MVLITYIYNMKPSFGCKIHGFGEIHPYSLATITESAIMLRVVSMVVFPPPA